jgi:hypothetical protein
VLVEEGFCVFRNGLISIKQGFKIFIPEAKDGFTKISEGSRRRLAQLSIRLRITKKVRKRLNVIKNESVCDVSCPNKS